MLNSSLAEKLARFRILHDGRPPRAAYGADADEQDNGTVITPRLYSLMRQTSVIGKRLVEFEGLDSGLGAFAVTFG